ncbi:MAG: glycoside hydrolase family 57 protein [Candidatus Woesearchaeota archaeon]
MVAICFYFQVHQPYRMKNYHVFDIGKNSKYFDEHKNREIMQKVAKKCYIPATSLILDLVKKYNGKFKCSFSITGTALEQFEEYAPEVIDLFKQLADTGHVEFLSETYHHSLSFLFSKEEFKEQVLMHEKKLKEILGVTPKVFRNTELIFYNELAIELDKMGYKAVLAEGADRVLGWRSPNFIYKSVSANIPLLLKNYKLSDDIAFRFSNHEWEEHPLTVPKFVNWVNNINGNGEVVNLFMDYETFGEHQWEDKGIFQFLEHLPEEFLKHPHNSFMTPSEVVDIFPIRDELDVHHPVSWADVERDLSAWRGNAIQEAALKHLYDIEKDVKMTNDHKLIEDWRKLTTSDHFYYMCTKWFNDGDVHKYFNPYDSPYDSYIAFMNVLKDIEGRMANNMILKEVN